MKNLEARQQEMRERHAVKLSTRNNPPVVLPSPPQVPKQIRKTNERVSEPGPNDREYLRIREVESRLRIASPNITQHKLVAATAQNLKNCRPDGNGLLQLRGGTGHLSVRVSKESVDRALRIMNAIVQALEAEGFVLAAKADKSGTAEVFGQVVEFELTEKLSLKSRREVRETPTWTRTLVEYEPSGQLEFRVRDQFYGFRKGCRDGKTQPLEIQVSKCLGLVLREGRDRKIWAEQQKLHEIEQQKKRQEMAELAPQMWEEEKRVQEFEALVSAWSEAEKMRGFVAALEKFWTQQGHTLTPATPNGDRLVWMRQQADRKDPMVPSPPSILDRKHELNRWH